MHNENKKPETNKINIKENEDKKNEKKDIHYKQSTINNSNNNNNNLISNINLSNNNNNSNNNIMQTNNLNLHKSNYINNFGYNPNITLINTINIINYLNTKFNELKIISKELNDLKKFGLSLLFDSNNVNHYLSNFINININNNPNILPITNDINNNIILNQNNPNNLENKGQIYIKTEYINQHPKEKKIVKIKNKIPDKNIINIDDIISKKETRTVVRLSPIPPHYSVFDISKLLDKYLKIEKNKNQRIYKALYTPLSKSIGKNLGFCLIMMVKPKYVIQFYNTFNGLKFNKKKCKKECSVVWADNQKDDIMNSDDPLKSPIIFNDTIIDSDEDEDEK